MSKTKPEYPRDGCPRCYFPVRAVMVTCDMDEEHERWQCQNVKCGYDEINEYELVTVNSAADMEHADDVVDDTLDAAALLKANKVLPSLSDWVKARVTS